MSYLAIDTATEACSAALEHEGQVYSRFEIAPRQHARLILPMVESLLDEAGCRRDEIEWIAFGRGPGAFTGVRIAAGVAHGLAMGLGCGLFPVSSLAALAMDAHERGGAERVLACLDARMGEVYWGAFQIEQGRPVPVIEERVCSPDAVSLGDLNHQGLVGTGPGWAVYADRLSAALGVRPEQTSPDRFPHAADMLRIAHLDVQAGDQALSPAQALPVYLRDRFAEPAKR